VAIPVERASVSALLSAAALSAALLSFAPSASAESPLDVATTSGAVHGIANGLTEEWRGIPYAAPPVDSLRWQRPQPPASWAGTRDATTFAPWCIQIDFEGGTIGDEDCLYLNVFRPTGTSASDGLPVMVHLHPGGNFFFHGYEEASALVSRGVIVVTLNYRLGAFGFMGHPALTELGLLPEQGLLDQVAALQWVQSNIAAFGGDPTNVTLFGMSAGSFDTVALAASPLAVGLIHRAAAETAAFWPATGVGQSIADKEAAGLGVADALGCATAPVVGACLMTAPASDIVLALDGYDNGPLVGGSVLPASALAAFEEHGAGVPLLIGSNREEAVGYILGPGDEPSDPTGNPAGNGAWTKGFTSQVYADVVGAKRLGEARALYPTSDYDPPAWAAVAILTDAVYTCPTRRVARAAGAHGPVYRYLFTHVMENDPSQADYRAFHTLEDTFLWHHFYPLPSGDPYPPSAGEEVLSSVMADYWTNFAKAGDPNGSGLPVWSMDGPAGESLLQLDDPIVSIAGFHVEQCGLMDSLAAPFAECGSLCHFFGGSAFWHRFRQ